MSPAASVTTGHKRGLVGNLEHFAAAHSFDNLNIAEYCTKLPLLGYIRIDNLKQEILCSISFCNGNWSIRSNIIISFTCILSLILEYNNYQFLDVLHMIGALWLVYHKHLALVESSTQNDDHCIPNYILVGDTHTLQFVQFGVVGVLVCLDTLV